MTPREIVALAGPRLALAAPVHGTGCALATAIACNLAAGLMLEAACRKAKQTVAAQIAAPVWPGRGRAAVR
ncbi:bifunctional hydroxy-methylpyrimidine kinase/ hydroxy-phosphomethylpyrimidine kinase [compost metagenome]